MSLIELHNVSKGFGRGEKRAEVLRDIHLKVEEGEFVCIIGYSGAGKTTLMNLLAGLSLPDGGSVSVAGKPVTGPSPERAIIFQNYSLLPWLTAEQNIALAVDEVFRKRSAKERADHVAKHIAMVKLSHAAHKLPRELSGGMRQRVAVARGLAMDPRVLLLDEPLSALDALTRAVLQDEISDIWQRQKKTVIWITNDPDEAVLLADRVIPLSPGPRATLGPSFSVDIGRPRDRKELNHDARFKALRRDIINWLIEARGAHAVQSRKLVLPDILPEDLATVNSLQFLTRRGPRRRSEIVREEVEVAA